jgi:hypothetical protein
MKFETQISLALENDLLGGETKFNFSSACVRV